MFTASVRRWFPPAAGRSAGWLPATWLALVIWLAVGASAAHADGIELSALDLTRGDEGLLLGYTASVVLPHAVEDALQKGVPLHFVAEAEVFRSRWYWRDKRVARATRTWRLTWQPLTRRYRVNFGSLSQNYDSLSDALWVVQRATRWKLAEAGDLDDGDGQYIEFSLRLDTSQLPRPLQISFGGQAEWALEVERRLAVPAAR
ncbi:DUF4390 domain-containing protein [Methylibium sp. Pch-M]|uniref:DUF4390 domain-containing protein n=1 Tax=Methylibium sp. Pch-M TaxID=2082386 RepID=UPI00101125D6|nr:DUF4390 domain-containing protein [Methylibium sp. Pch-M]QAZ39818.1 DUF4390 domain-containing protein [Methylibium sp. Pch-M]